MPHTWLSGSVKLHGQVSDCGRVAEVARKTTSFFHDSGLT